VLVLRQGSAPVEKVERILVAVDGSDRCLQAVTTAIEHLNLVKSDVSITISHIVTLNPLVASFTPQSFVTIMEENLLMEGEIALANAKKAFSGKGFKSVEIELGHGNAAGEIIKLQEKIKANLIVIGSQGKGAVKHFLMGHVANRIATHASAPTVVAR
jgi:nucleotide-binding universal stress UspA family protein